MLSFSQHSRQQVKCKLNQHLNFHRAGKQQKEEAAQKVQMK